MSVWRRWIRSADGPPRSGEDVFTRIYRRNLWCDPESRSGPGSGRARTETLRQDLAELLREMAVGSLLDIPCGDFNWMGELADQLGSYVGADIVPELIEENRRKNAAAARTFVRLDMREDALPRVDLVLCRDGLVHLSFRDAWRSIAGIEASGSTYLLATTFPAREGNEDVPTGGWRPLNMQRPPFLFSAPLRFVPDRPSDGTYPDKGLGLWRIVELPAAPR